MTCLKFVIGILQSLAFLVIFNLQKELCLKSRLNGSFQNKDRQSHFGHPWGPYSLALHGEMCYVRRPQQ